MEDRPEENHQVNAPPFRFRLPHLLYAVALVAVSLAIGHPVFLIPAIFVLLFWAYVFQSESRPRALLRASIAAFIAICLFLLLLPMVCASRESSRRPQCANNLKQLSLALLAYHERYGQFPPACIRDKDGKPMHSWRVLLLPFLERRDLYEQYRWDEPWDGPNNRKLAEAPRYCRCPSDLRYPESTKWTRYVAVTGSRTVWGKERSCRLSEIEDGASNTLMLIEYHGEPIPWTEPRDLDFDQVIQGASTHWAADEGPHLCKDKHARHAALADGGVLLLADDMPADAWSALLTIDDGQPASARDYDARGLPDSDNWIGPLSMFQRLAAAAFVFLAVLPFFFIWRKRPAS